MEFNFVKENSRKTVDKATYWYELVNCSQKIALSNLTTGLKFQFYL